MNGNTSLTIIPGSSSIPTNDKIAIGNQNKKNAVSVHINIIGAVKAEIRKNLTEPSISST